MKYFKYALPIILLASIASSCSKNKTWNCECQNSGIDHGIYEGSQKDAQEWCDEKSNNDSCVLIGHK